MEKNLIVVDSSVDITGAFNCAVGICRSLQSDYDTTLMIPNGSVERLARLGENTLRATKVSVGMVPVLRRELMSIVLFPIKLLVLALYLRMQLKSSRDIIVLNDINHLVATLLRVFLWRGRIFVWVRSHAELYGSVRSKLYFWDLWLSRATIICVSNVVNRRLPRYLGGVTLYDYVDLPKIGEHPHAERTCFIMIANYIEGKGHDLAIRAVYKLVSSGFSPAVKFYGSTMGLAKNKKYLSELKRYARDRQLDKFIEFNPQIIPDESYYLNALASLSLSNLEALSMSVMESCAYGVPVIATRSGGPEELIINAQTGFLIDRTSEDQLVNSMLILLRNSSLSYELGRNARLRMAQQFTPKKFAENLKNIIGVET